MKFLLRTVYGDPKQYGNFRFAELDSLCELVGCPYPCYEKDAGQTSPFVYADIPTEAMAQEILRRAVLIKGLYECWGEGATVEECATAAREYNAKLKEQWLTKDQSWCLRVEGFGVTYTAAEQEVLRNNFKDIGFEGPVNLKKPDNLFVIFTDVGHTCDKAGETDKTPKRVFFCRELTKSKRSEIDKYSLKKRKYIGPTSTAAELAFLMANQALAAKGSVVFDPFVGTGSLVVAAAHYGAMTIGSDIDWKVIHGKMRGATSNIFENFQQYKLPRPELLCSDQSQMLWRCCQQTEEEQKTATTHFRFDSIVCDPPYGVRAGAKKSGTNRRVPKEISKEMMVDHVPASQPYDVEDVMNDLLDFAAATLKMGGRLVYLLPTPANFPLEELPTHPCLTLHSISEQVLRWNFSRHLVTMKKTKEFEKGLRAKRRDKNSDPAPKFANVKEVAFAPCPATAEARKPKEQTSASAASPSVCSKSPESKRPKLDGHE